MSRDFSNQRGLLDALLGDGRFLMILTGCLLVLSGGFALFLSAVGDFLPHDVEYLGMSPDELCSFNDCRIVNFMFHDRVSFGGALIAIGALYMWLAEFPLRQREPWAWCLLLLSGLVGFTSFLTYLGYGYLDSWHGMATVFLIPIFLIGLVRSYASLKTPFRFRSLLIPSRIPNWRTREGFGRCCYLMMSLGLIGAGLTIMTVGMTCVFVPQDLEYMRFTAEELQLINPRLIPLIAHDRAGFGGAVASGGLAMFFAVWCAQPSRSLWEVMTLSGGIGFTTAIGVHPAIGYTDFLHLAPAYFGAVLFLVATVLCYEPMTRTRPITLNDGSAASTECSNESG